MVMRIKPRVIKSILRVVCGPNDNETASRHLSSKVISVSRRDDQMKEYVVCEYESGAKKPVVKRPIKKRLECGVW